MGGREDIKVMRWKTGKPCLGEWRGQNGSFRTVLSLQPTLELFQARECGRFEVSWQILPWRLWKRYKKTKAITPRLKLNVLNFQHYALWTSDIGYYKRFRATKRRIVIFERKFYRKIWSTAIGWMQKVTDEELYDGVKQQTLLQKVIHRKLYGFLITYEAWMKRMMA